MNDINSIGIFDVLGLIGFMGFYIMAKVWVYSKEYGSQRDKEDIVIKRGSEWDYNTKGNENKKDI